MKKINERPFIFTEDIELKNELLRNGFTLISESNTKYTFLNNGKLTFDKDKDEDKLKKLCFTNILCMDEA